MHECHDYQVRMLEYLYGLLDDAEAGGLLAHVAGCEGCRAAHEEARRQQGLLAKAALVSFPEVRFEPPADEPISLPLPAPSSPLRRIRWAAAAAVLLAAAGLATVAARFSQDHARVREEVAFHGAAAAETAKKAESLQTQVAKLPEDFKRRQQEVFQAARARQLNVVVTGPARAPVGAPSEYRIATQTFDGRPARARLDVRFLDDKGNAVLEQKDVPTRGDHRVTLEPALPLAPGSALALEVTARREGDDDPAGVLRERVELAAPAYVTHLATDKPMYLPGETVRFRSLTLERFALRPPDDDFRLVYSITKPTKERSDILFGASRLTAGGPSAADVLGPDGKPLRGVGSGAWDVPADAPGGEYTLTVRDSNDRFLAESRTFLVHRYQPAPFRKELDFDRSSYGPGEPVVARCRALRPDGTPLAGRPVNGRVLIDGMSYAADGTPGAGLPAWTTDAQGYANVAFKLPAKMTQGQGTLTVVFADGKETDTLVRTIPIVLGGFQVDFFPEGGDLIAGLPARVYFQVRTPRDRPGDLRGRVVDETGAVVAEATTIHDAALPGVNRGLGAFAFTPEAGHTYDLKIDEPLGSASVHRLPAVKADGVALTVPDGVTRPGEPIRARVRATGGDRTFLVGAYCRGRMLDSRRVTVKDGATGEAALLPVQEIGGVYRVTVFEERVVGDRRATVPVAERLVYREPAERLKIDVRPDRKSYMPGDKVTLTVTARDEKDRPAGAVLLLRVVDQRVLALADEKAARSMSAHFLLTSEVKRAEDLEYADFLLSDRSEARVALDLLLGTQGWRRFAEQDPTKFREQYARDADRVLVSVAPTRFDFLDQDLKRLREEFRTRDEELRAEKDKAMAAFGNLANDGAAKATAERLRRYDDLVYNLQRWSAPALGALMALVVVVSLLAGAARTPRRAVPFFAGLAAGVLLLLGLQTHNSGVERERAAELLRARNQMAEQFAQADAARRAAQVAQAQLAPADAPKAMVDPRVMAPKKPDLRMLEIKPRLVAPAVNPDMQNRLDRALGKPAPKADAPAPPNPPPAPPRVPGVLAPAPEFVPPPASPPLVVREYAHALASGRDAALRQDFTETLLWKPVFVVPAEGKATVSFELSDSVTAFDVTAWGHTLDGRLGSSTSQIESRLPVTLDPKAPQEVTAGDRIDLPITVTSSTPEARDVRLTTTATGLKLLAGNAEERVTVPAGGTARRVLRFQPEMTEGTARVEVRGVAAPFAADGVVRTVRVVPDGFPVADSKSDLLEGAAAHEVVLPETWQPGTLRCRVQAYPSTLATLLQGLEALLGEPHGCFEQTSSVNYPNLLILQYLEENKAALPEVEARARRLLASGYAKLASFECAESAQGGKRGYEWFGAPDAPHEALTAYGLMQFHDMARSHPVDAAMLGRTRQYLLASRDGKGGFRRNPRALDTFGRAPEDVTNAYVVWALTEAGGKDDLDAELRALEDRAKTSKDPYFLALVANSLLNRGRSEEGVALLKTVAAAQKPDGHLDAERTSITGSAGRDLQIETTALALLGWLKANRPGDFTEPVRRAADWVGRQRGPRGGFGSTQATVLTLKALIAYTRVNRRTAEPGELSLFVGAECVGQLAFPAGVQDVLTVEFADPEKRLRPGKNELRVEVSGKNSFPHTLSWSYRAPKPVSAEGCAVRLTTALDRDAAKEGETVRLSLMLQNVTDQGQGMAVAVVGLPAGLTLPDDLKQLREHARPREGGKTPGLIDAFETRGREVVLYWRGLGPGQKIEVPLDLVCRYPGAYRGPASRAYLYYNADAKCWVEPLAARVAASE